MTAHNPRPAAVLIGLRGSGKTTLGRLLAARRKVAFVDLDDRTVSASGHPSVSAMFRAEGEPAFRAAERAELAHALAHDAAEQPTTHGFNIILQRVTNVAAALRNYIVES